MLYQAILNQSSARTLGGSIISANAPDLLILGAGPAGLACAIAATQRGLQVRILDAGVGPLDKACGEGLLPDALASLTALGVRPHAGHAIAGVRFHCGNRIAEANFVLGQGLGLRRTTLHGAMLDRAAALGVQVEWHSTLKHLQSLPARFVVGADGGQSRIRTLSGLDNPANTTATTRRIGLRQHFAHAPWSSFVEVFWADGAQAYVTPVGAHEIGVAFLSTRKFLSIGHALASFPELRDRLAAAEPTSTARGAITVTRRLRRVTTGNIALLGDASGSVDAITGEGLNLCFRQAEALAEAIAAGSLAPYERSHRAILRTPRLMSAALLQMDRSPVIRRAAIFALAASPSLFQGLLRVHAGATMPTSPVRLPAGKLVQHFPETHATP